MIYGARASHEVGEDWRSYSNPSGTEWSDMSTTTPYETSEGSSRESNEDDDDESYDDDVFSLYVPSMSEFGSDCNASESYYTDSDDDLDDEDDPSISWIKQTEIATDCHLLQNRVVKQLCCPIYTPQWYDVVDLIVEEDLRKMLGPSDQIVRGKSPLEVEHGCHLGDKSEEQMPWFGSYEVAANALIGSNPFINQPREESIDQVLPSSVCCDCYDEDDDDVTDGEDEEDDYEDEEDEEEDFYAIGGEIGDEVSFDDGEDDESVLSDEIIVEEQEGSEGGLVLRMNPASYELFTGRRLSRPHCGTSSPRIVIRIRQSDPCLPILENFRNLTITSSTSNERHDDDDDQYWEDVEEENGDCDRERSDSEDFESIPQSSRESSRYLSFDESESNDREEGE